MKVLHINENLGMISGIEKYIRCWDEWSREFGISNQVMEFVRAKKESFQYVRQFFVKQFVKIYSSRNRNEKINLILKSINEFDPNLVIFHKFDDNYLADKGVLTAKFLHDNRMHCLRGHGFELLSGRTCDRHVSVQCILRCGGLGRDPADGRMKFHGLIRKKTELRLLRNYHFLLTPSRYVKNQLVKNGLQTNRIHVFSPLIENKIQTKIPTSRQNRILFCGRIDRGKGVDMLLESVRNVKEKYELRIVGDGRDFEKYRRFVAHTDLRNHVLFLGRLYGSAVAKEYREASIVVIPSRMPEAFCFSGLEALVWGKPVVAFRVGAVKEWLNEGENGYLVNAGNTHTFAQRLDELLRNPDLRDRMGQNGKKIVSCNYSIAGCGRQLASKLKNLIRNGDG